MLVLMISLSVHETAYIILSSIYDEFSCGNRFHLIFYFRITFYKIIF